MEEFIKKLRKTKVYADDIEMMLATDSNGNYFNSAIEEQETIKKKITFCACTTGDCPCAAEEIVLFEASLALIKRNNKAKEEIIEKCSKYTSLYGLLAMMKQASFMLFDTNIRNFIAFEEYESNLENKLITAITLLWMETNLLWKKTRQSIRDGFF